MSCAGAAEPSLGGSLLITRSLDQFPRLSPQLQQLLCSPHFQRVSGRHLAAAEMAFGFRFAALPGAWPRIQLLGDLIGLPRWVRASLNSTIPT